VIVRPETIEDVAAVERVNREAFGGEAEPRLVELIRASDRLVPDLSLVAADDDGEIVGHIMFSYVDLADARVLELAPMSVLPARQRGGIGSRLVEEGLGRADNLREPLVLVLGHPWFYPRFGFEPSTRYGIEPPFPLREEVYMVKPLGAYRPGLRGKVRLPPAFAAVPSGGET
jgi:putative acetyltransferase